MMTLWIGFLRHFIQILLFLKVATPAWSSTIASSSPSSDVLKPCSGIDQCFENKNFLYEAEILFSADVNVTAQVFTSDTNHGEHCLSLDRQMCEHTGFPIPQDSPFFYISSMKTFNNLFIQILCLTNQQIACIQPGFFESYQAINGLIMSHNVVKDTNWISALSNASLLYLDLSHNQISSVEKNVFENFSHLLWLDLSYNEITSIGTLSLNGLPHLQVLDLSFNFLTNETIHKNAFGHLRSLVHLSLSHNRFFRLAKAKVIGLDKSKLETLDFHGQLFLKKIETYTFDGLQNLSTLNLSYCGLTDLDFGWLNGGPEKSLKTLDLSFNYFTKLKSHYFVSYVIESKWRLPSFYSSILDPKQHPYIVTPAVHIDTHDMSHSDYHILLSANHKHRCYQSLPKLTWLSLKNNPWLSIIGENTFKFLPDLNYLFIQNCNVTKLKIASTEFHYDGEAVRKTLPSLKAVWFWGNPLKCDCHVRSLQSHDFIKNNSNCLKQGNLFVVNPGEYFYQNQCRIIGYREAASCYQSGNWQKVAIRHISTNFLSCPEEPVSMLVVMIIGPLTFTASIFFLIICGFCAVSLSRLRRYQSGFYYTNSFQQRNVKQKATSSKPTTKRKRKVQFGFPLAHTSSPKPSYRTNLVLEKMGTPQIQTKIISHPVLTAMRRKPGSQSRSPSPSPRLRTKKLQNYSPAPRRRIPDSELTKDQKHFLEVPTRQRNSRGTHCYHDGRDNVSETTFSRQSPLPSKGKRIERTSDHETNI